MQMKYVKSFYVAESDAAMSHTFLIYLELVLKRNTLMVRIFQIPQTEQTC